MNDAERLKKLFDFTDADLDANRAGKLSERQRDHNQKRVLTAASNKATSNLTLVMFLVMFVIFIGFSLRYGNQLGPLVLVAILVWLGLVYVLSKVILVLTRYRLHQATSRQWQTSQAVVQQMTGRLILESDGEHQHILLDEFELTNSSVVDNDVRLWRLESGKRYTLYYVLDPLYIVAAELAE